MSPFSIRHIALHRPRRPFPAGSSRARRGLHRHLVGRGRDRNRLGRELHPEPGLHIRHVLRPRPGAGDDPILVRRPRSTGRRRLRIHRRPLPDDGHRDRGAVEPGGIGRDASRHATFTPTSTTTGTLAYNVGATPVNKDIVAADARPRIALGGSYVGSAVVVSSGCAGAGSQVFDVDPVVTRSTGEQLSIGLTFGSQICTMQGTYAQEGTLFRIPTATYVCTNGRHDDGQHDGDGLRAQGHDPSGSRGVGTRRTSTAASRTRILLRPSFPDVRRAARAAAARTRRGRPRRRRRR